jgi:small subunit ribosomal protein S17
MDCKDEKCPRHGSLSTRGSVLDGLVVSDKMQATVVVQRDGMVKVRKYDRYKRSSSRVPAHNPPCINAKVGDNVKIMECRKISKTVSFVVVEKLGQKNEQEKDKPVKKAKAKKKKKLKKEAANG